MNDCLFCKIISGEIPATKIYEDEYSFAFLDIKPVNEGHTLIVPKEHSRNIYEISDESLKNLSISLKKVSVAIKNGLGADGINVVMNNDKDAGQVIFHSHLHVIPRFDGDGIKHWKGHPYKDTESEVEIAEKIKNSF